MGKSMRRRNVMIAILILVVGVGWGLWRRSESDSDKNIRIVSVERGDVVRTLTLSGRIRAEREANLRFLSLGKLGYVRVGEGDRVKKGMAMMGLDTRDLAAAETAAYYSYIAADANAKQVEDEVKGHDNDETFVLKNKRVAAQTVRDKAYDTWQSAIRAKNNASLIAPFDGIVARMTVNVVGQVVGVADGVDVVDPDSLYFGAEVDEADLSKVAVGGKVEVELDAYPNRKFEGEVKIIEFVAHISDAGATVFSVRVKTLSEEDIKILRLGMNGDATLVAGQVKNVLMLPIEAVVDGEVELVNGEKKKIGMGLEGDDLIEVKEGLKEGDRVVVK